MLGLVVAIGAELIAVLDDELGSRHSGQGKKGQNSQQESQATSTWSLTIRWTMERDIPRDLAIVP